MAIHIDKLMESGCNSSRDKVCRSRGGESCAFDGALIVLQPIADAAHIVHGPIACCGNSWEGRGTLSKMWILKGEGTSPLHRMGFTTDMNELDIVYGSEEKLAGAIRQTVDKVRPKAVFVYATCVSGLIGEDVESVCKKAEEETGVPVIPVNAPGFVGPKNLGNRIAGEVLLDHVIGRGEPEFSTEADINLIGEYNIAGDLWLVEPLLKEAGIRVLSRMTGDSTFEEITYAHRAKLNVVVCGRALINVAKEMERKYGISYVEVSFFGRTEMTKGLRKIAESLNRSYKTYKTYSFEPIIAREEERLSERLSGFSDLKGKKAVLYSGGVKSWSFISALRDLGIDVVAVGTKKSTFEDEEKIKELLGDQTVLLEDTNPKNLLRMIREKVADLLVAGGRNQYLAIKEGIPFVDVNQERHHAYAGYEGLVNLAEQISNSIRFYSGAADSMPGKLTDPKPPVVINPIGHSQSIGAAIAFQGIDRCLPVIHGAQGCNFLAKVLLTKHFREPIALASTKLFAEDVIMGSDEKLTGTVKEFHRKNKPDLIAVLTTGLTEVKGDDITAAMRNLRTELTGLASDCLLVHVATPDYEGGFETGYARAVKAVVDAADFLPLSARTGEGCKDRVNVLAGLHLTPADFTELREIIESFGLAPLFLPDLSALDGSRSGFSPLASGGIGTDQIREMGLSRFTLAFGTCMESPAAALNEKSGIEYRVFDGVSGLQDTDIFLETLSALSGMPVPERLLRQRGILTDGLRDAQFFLAGKRCCLALEPDSAVQFSHLLAEAGMRTRLAVIPSASPAAEEIMADEVRVGGLFSIDGKYDLIISNSHAGDTAGNMNVPLYQAGFPTHKVLGNTNRVTIGYRGALSIVNEIGNILMQR